MKYIKIFFAMVAAALVACSDEVPINNNSPMPSLPDRPTVAVPLAISIAREEGNIASRAVEDTETSVDATIHDVWVLQFERTLVDAAANDNEAVNDDARIIYWHYIPEYDPADPGKSTVRLAETSHPGFVVVLANELDPFLYGRFDNRLSFGEMRQWTSKINDQQDLFSATGAINEDLSFPANANHLIHFNGIAPLRSGVNASTPALSVPLRRNIARIDIEIVIGDNLKVDDVDFTIDDMVLCDVPGISYMLTNGNWRADFTNGCTNFTAEDGSLTIFPEPFNFNSFTPIVTPQASLPAGIDQRIRFYTPANQSGRYTPTPGRSGAAHKGIYTPGFATYFFMKAHYKKDGVECPVIYKIYLGEDLGETNPGQDPNYQHDFNIVANHSYNYTITLNNIGDVDADWRVEDFGTVTFPNDLEHLSNCYILNPPEVPGYARRFSIPVARVDEFWGDSELGDDETNILSDGNRWQVELLWCDFDAPTLNASLPDDLKFGFAPGGDSGVGKSSYFTVNIPYGVNGNAVIALRKISEGIISDILWSWHLWITDYNPDKEIILNDDIYLYHVPNGNICRMGGEAWTSGDYKNVVMMDRNLGATVRPEPAYTQTRADNGVYYEYGRKDPFSLRKQLYTLEGTTAHPNVEQKYGSWNYYVDDVVMKNIANPIRKWYHIEDIKHYRSRNGKFMGGTALQSTANIWLDHRLGSKKAEYLTSDIKSIFDPSPLGWKLITQDGLKEITTANANRAIVTNYEYIDPEENRRGFMLYNSGDDIKDGYYNGVMYWPNVDPWKEQVPTTTIYFPNHYYYRSWAAGYQILDASSISFTYAYNTWSAGNCVRCIKILNND